MVVAPCGKQQLLSFSVFFSILVFLSQSYFSSFTFSVSPLVSVLHLYFRQASEMYRVFIKYCVFPRTFNILRPLPRKDRGAAIGCTENVHSDQMRRSPTCRGEVAVNLEKNTIFNEHPVYYSYCSLGDRSHTFHSPKQVLCVGIFIDT